jgi:hypothetical protein
LFKFDQTGILDEVAKQKNERKTEIPSSALLTMKHSGKKFFESAEGASLAVEVAELREEMKKLKEENTKLWRAIEKLQVTQRTELSTTASSESSNSSQQFFKGRGSGRGY